MSKAPEAMKVIPTEVKDVLRDAFCEGKTLKLQGVLPRPLYEKVDEFIKLMGGKWNGRRECHAFKTDATEVVRSALASGKVQDKKKHFQFFATPESIAKRMVEVLDLSPDDEVLEPSAGDGRLVRAVLEAGCAKISAFELQDELREALQSDLPNLQILGSDFIAGKSKGFDKIVMNPPFTNGQDVQHVMHAFRNFLKIDGQMSAIMSKSWQTGRDRVSSEFREWFEAMELEGKAEIIEIEAGAFKASGTGVPTVLVWLQKPWAEPVKYVLTFGPKNEADERQEGWSNSATWMFSFYFLQERANYERLVALKRENPPDLMEKAVELFKGAYDARKMERMANWVVGAVNADEIVSSVEI